MSRRKFTAAAAVSLGGTFQTPLVVEKLDDYLKINGKYSEDEEAALTERILTRRK
jgi:hypothetical protein